MKLISEISLKIFIYLFSIIIIFVTPFVVFLSIKYIIWCFEIVFGIKI